MREKPDQELKKGKARKRRKNSANKLGQIIWLIGFYFIKLE